MEGGDSKEEVAAAGSDRQWKRQHQEMIANEKFVANSTVQLQYIQYVITVCTVCTVTGLCYGSSKK